MNEPQAPPPPPPAPPAPPAEKKSSALKWILIGCLAIILLGVLVFGACSVFVAKKAKDFAGEMSDNPAMAAAEMIVRVNPEIELVSKDEGAQTLTIRNKESGEVVTLDLEDIKEGRFSWEADGKTVTIDGSSAAAGGEGGLITVQDESGDQTVRIGTGATDQVPDWVPTYPGASAEAPFLMTSEQGLQGTVAFETADALADVEAYYVSELEGGGFEVEKSTFSTADMQTTMLSATEGDRTVIVSITRESGNPTRVGINFGKGN